MIKNKLSYLDFGSAAYTGTADDYVRFTMSHQLMDADTWKNFVRVFTEDSDDENQGWRCEYWGKMMRGACLTYMYNKDKRLYAVLEQTVRDLLGTQRPDGRFSTYSAENQLHGWDIWGRKYVLTAMLHFIRICKDKSLKAEILAALCRHADALIEKVGDESEGKVKITKASNHWLGVNSASILDAILELYSVTGEKRYLEFGEYIIGTGGIEGGNLIDLALENKLMPYEYPENKAYETMSFFEGLLTYYQLTGKEKYLTAVLNFVQAVDETDITVIGCSGCTHELFDHSKVMQIHWAENIMQETCVTVTWMRLMAKLHLLTGEKKYFDRMEQSAWNALYGSANDNRLPQYSMLEHVWFDPLPFDSYAPLYNNSRGRGVGGWQRFSFGGGYGCCACIAAAGIALFPLCALLKEKDGFTVNGLLPGTVTETTPAGRKVSLRIESGMPASPKVKITVSLASPETFTLRVRVPDYFENAALTVNGEPVSAEGYAVLTREWKDGDTVALTAGFSLKTEVIEDRSAFTYGPLVLALDAAKNPGVDISEDIVLRKENGVPVCRFADPLEKDHEMLRVIIERADGKAPLAFTDFASCGKRWTEKPKQMTVWMNLK
ncbi:MAG: glycoside hydrolase family 127 protein [Oscillospiraceae bacterium]|nr:glycoside hydrolase family 127 protein [Oscillospiraceae bacterium]